MIKQIYASSQLTAVEQQDIQHFIKDARSLRCLSQPDADTQVWLGNHRALVFKVFDIHRLRQRWRARWKLPCPIYGQRYGWAERANAVRFGDLALPGLSVRAYLESAHPLLCARQVVAYPYLEGYDTLQQILEAGHAPFAALNAVEPVLLKMAQDGVFHLDLNSRNVMLDARHNVRIIDFEYMAWQQRQPGAMYAYYLGYLWQKWARSSLLSSDFDHWFDTMLEQRQALFSETKDDLLASFHLGKERELSRSQRYRMFS
ncbi:phosphotransferase [Pseudomonas sp. PB120]|uniref:phosphotransferase n=1 Tax=Pseudomonas sp. PB120 TaxID=2494700 RepID=UPI0012FE3ACB|nr:phosphotransferase [Pseudomonas sp. PB120]